MGERLSYAQSTKIIGVIKLIILPEVAENRTQNYTINHFPMWTKQNEKKKRLTSLGETCPTM